MDAIEIAFIVKGIREIDEAGLLRDFEMTVASELRQLTQRKRDAWYRDDGTGRYVARLLGIDPARCEAIAVGTRATVVINEINVYLGMIDERARRDAAKDRAVAEYFDGCQVEMHHDWTDEPDSPADAHEAGPIMIANAASVPASVQLARAKAAANGKGRRT
ncbi:MAG: hypothetical protein ACREJM_05135 [Candidatus Saccharimonadales bacterium]